jgi:hypothetical protein
VANTPLAGRHCTIPMTMDSGVEWMILYSQASQLGWSPAAVSVVLGPGDVGRHGDVVGDLHQAHEARVRLDAELRLADVGLEG